MIIAGHGASAMPSRRFIARSTSRRSRMPSAGATRWRIALIASLHLAALAIMAFDRSATSVEARLPADLGHPEFLLARRSPAGRPSSAALSLVMIVVWSWSRGSSTTCIWMTANFLDVMIIDSDTISFLFIDHPGPAPERRASAVVVAAAAGGAALALRHVPDAACGPRSTAFWRLPRRDHGGVVRAAAGAIGRPS